MIIRQSLTAKILKKYNSEEEQCYQLPRTCLFVLLIQKKIYSKTTDIHFPRSSHAVLNKIFDESSSQNTLSIKCAKILVNKRDNYFIR